MNWISDDLKDRKTWIIFSVGAAAGFVYSFLLWWLMDLSPLIITLIPLGIILIIVTIQVIHLIQILFGKRG